MRARGAVAIVILAGCASGQKAPAPVDDNAGRLAAPALGPPAGSVDSRIEPPEPSAPTAAPVDSSPSASSAPSAATSPDAPPEPTERHPTASETRACAARGGTIQPVCMLGQLTCVIRYRDGGKRCSDKSDCLGECQYEGPEPPPPNAAGRCQRTSDPCGCKALVHHGNVEPTLCAD